MNIAIIMSAANMTPFDRATFVNDMTQAHAAAQPDASNYTILAGPSVVYNCFSYAVNKTNCNLTPQSLAQVEKLCELYPEPHHESYHASRAEYLSEEQGRKGEIFLGEAQGADDNIT